jgi:hypothetical protein
VRLRCGCLDRDLPRWPRGELVLDGSPAWPIPRLTGGGASCVGQVRVHGTADARVSQGLVGLLASGLSGARPDDVVALDPYTVARVSPPQM